MTGLIRHLGIAMVAVAAFAWGIVLEAWADDHLSPIATILPLLLVLTAALAVSFSERTGWVTAVVLGGVAGCLAGIVLVLGAFSLFALEIDGRDLNDLGGPDLTWQGALIIGLVFVGVAGAALGAACGAAARALRTILAQRPQLGR